MVINDLLIHQTQIHLKSVETHRFCKATTLSFLLIAANLKEEIKKIAMGPFISFRITH